MSEKQRRVFSVKCATKVWGRELGLGGVIWKSTDVDVWSPGLGVMVWCEVLSIGGMYQGQEPRSGFLGDDLEQHMAHLANLYVANRTNGRKNKKASFLLDRATNVWGRELDYEGMVCNSADVDGCLNSGAGGGDVMWSSAEWGWCTKLRSRHRDF